MKNLLAIATVLFLAVGSGLAAQKRPANTEVLVVADALPNIAEDFQPSADKPVYYILTNAPFSLGEPVAGVKFPEPSAVERLVVAALAKQGYVRTQVGGPTPSLWILATWGEANFVHPAPIVMSDMVSTSFDEQTHASSETVSLPAQMSITWDRVALGQLLGAHRDDVLLTPSELDRFQNASSTERLYLSLSALDAQAWKHKQKRVLWRTSMTIDGRNTFVDVAPVMLASGATYFGRDSKQPVFIDERDRRSTNVNVGDIIVVGDGEAPRSPARPKSGK